MDKNTGSRYVHCKGSIRDVVMTLFLLQMYLHLSAFVELNMLILFEMASLYLITSFGRYNLFDRTIIYHRVRICYFHLLSSWYINDWMYIVFALISVVPWVLPTQSTWPAKNKSSIKVQSGKKRSLYLTARR